MGKTISKPRAPFPWARFVWVGALLTLSLPFADAHAQKAKDTLRLAFTDPIGSILIYEDSKPETGLVAGAVFDAQVDAQMLGRLQAGEDHVVIIGSQRVFRDAVARILHVHGARLGFLLCAHGISIVER